MGSPRGSTPKLPAACLLLGSSSPDYREHSTRTWDPQQCGLIPTSDQDKINCNVAHCSDCSCTTNTYTMEYSYLVVAYLVVAEDGLWELLQDLIARTKIAIGTSLLLPK